MRPSLIRRLPLPPVPPRSTWNRVFPTNNFHIVNRLSSPGATAIGRGKRTQVADKALADSVVRALDIKRQDVVLEAYPGMGFLTRALLALPPASHPRKILAVEPSVDFNVHGLGVSSNAVLEGYSLEDERDNAKHALHQTRKNAMRILIDDAVKHIGSRNDSQSMLEHPDQTDILDTSNDPSAQQPTATHVFRAFPSVDEPALTIIDGTLFDWLTVPALESQGLLTEVERREWHEDPPNLHLIAQIPDSDMGEQLVSQWIGCIAIRSWLFRWGRVKMSFVVKPTLFDRLTAQPGTRAYCKLSVFTSALCDLHPGSDQYTPGPDSHVPVSLRKKHEREERQREIAKGGTPVEPVKALKPLQQRNNAKVASEAQVQPAKTDNTGAPKPHDRIDPLLSTDPDLWYPKPRRTATEQKQPPRPGMMVITLTPRVDAQILPEDKDVWDYVLRRMFVNPGSPLGVAINNVGMGATNLVPKLTDPTLPPDQRIDPEKWVREYTLQDWALVVKAFKAWPFAPDVLVLTSLLEEDNDTRQIGSGM